MMKSFLVEILGTLNKTKQLILHHSITELKSVLMAMSPMLENPSSIVLDPGYRLIPMSSTCSVLNKNELNVSFMVHESMTTILDTIVKHLRPFNKSIILDLSASNENGVEFAEIVSEYASSLSLKAYGKISCLKSVRLCPSLTSLSLEFGSFIDEIQILRRVALLGSLHIQHRSMHFV